jgi:hypothetical protein
MTSTTVSSEFNSVHSKQIAAEELDRWALEYTDAARALKALLLDLIRSRGSSATKPSVAELKRLEV